MCVLYSRRRRWKKKCKKNEQTTKNYESKKHSKHWRGKANLNKFPSNRSTMYCAYSFFFVYRLLDDKWFTFRCDSGFVWISRTICCVDVSLHSSKYNKKGSKMSTYYRDIDPFAATCITAEHIGWRMYVSFCLFCQIKGIYVSIHF